MSDAPLVGIIMGSKSDWETMRHAAETLEALRVPHECEVVSHIANSSDLFFLGRQLVKLATSRNLAR